MESSEHKRAPISPPNCNKMLIFGNRAFVASHFGRPDNTGTSTPTLLLVPLAEFQALAVLCRNSIAVYILSGIRLVDTWKLENTL